MRKRLNIRSAWVALTAMICALVMIPAAGASAATLNGTDVSSHNSLAQSNCAAIPGDCIVIKATEGNSYTW